MNTNKMFCYRIQCDIQDQIIDFDSNMSGISTLIKRSGVLQSLQYRHFNSQRKHGSLPISLLSKRHEINSEIHGKSMKHVSRKVSSHILNQSRRLSDERKALPTEAEVVICGGGVLGASVALHLKMLGWRNIVLIEQGK